MEKNKTIKLPLNSKGSPILKKMLEDKRAIRKHLQKGEKLADLKNKYHFVKPLSFYSISGFDVFLFKTSSTLSSKKFLKFF